MTLMINKAQVKYVIVNIFLYVTILCYGMAEKDKKSKTNEQVPLVDDSSSSKDEEKTNLRQVYRRRET